MLEDDLLVAQFDGFQAGIDQDFNSGRNGVCQSECVGRGHSVYHKARLVPPCYSFDDSAIVRCRQFSGQLVKSRLVVEAAFDTTELAGLGKPLEGLVDGLARAGIRKISRRPNLGRFGTDPIEDLSRQSSM